MQVVSQVTDGVVVPADVPATPVPTEGSSPSIPVEGDSVTTNSTQRPQDDGDISSQTPSARRRRRCSSSSPMCVPVTADAGFPMPPHELHEDDEEMDTQKFYNHGRKIAALVQPNEAWFQDVLSAFGLKDLCQVRFHTIHNGMLMAFVERWHPETSSFHLHHSEVSITLDDVAWLLQIPIRGTLLGHGRLTKEEVREMLIEELAADPKYVLEEVERLHWRTSICWILQHFSNIIGWGEVQDYTEAMLSARAFVPLRGNQVPDPYRHYLDRMVAEDV
ncbi:protein MAIN-LIKE 2-like [Vicia villosa]|uniref:protein MAIN-LIKE 2-like n=1 Tax=Vicia villosa TaxID=3911 RepID=UPI00273B457F|nr:protein MAIN-LIKE 2-like [Vicia villosa]